jgi:serine/threonine-protein kinase
MSSAAATLIGQKTPVSGQSTLPRTPPTPLSMRSGSAGTHVTTSGLPQPPPTPDVTGVPASVTPAVAERATAVPVAIPHRSALPWAIAALVLLGVGGGAYAYRGHIPALAGLLGAPAPVADTAAPTHTTAPAPVAAKVTEIAASVAATATANTAPAPLPAPVDAGATAPPSAPPGATDSQTMQARADTTTNSAADSANAPAARASQEGMQALHELPAAQAAAGAAAAAPQVAKVAPPQRPAAPPKPHVPTVAVVVAGDDVISAPAEEAVINALQNRGFRVIEGGHTHGSSPNLGALAGRADAVVFVNARPVGSQEIQYYGQSSTLYTVQLGIKAYRVADRSVLWSGNTQQVNFTSLNAAQKAREAIGPMLENVDNRLGEFRAHGRRG